MCFSPGINAQHFGLSLGAKLVLFSGALLGPVSGKLLEPLVPSWASLWGVVLHAPPCRAPHEVTFHVVGLTLLASRRANPPDVENRNKLEHGNVIEIENELEHETENGIENELEHGIEILNEIGVSNVSEQEIENAKRTRHR